MSRSYPIWNKVTRVPEFAKRLAFGAGESFEQTILVGTSASNSHELATIAVKRHEAPGGAVYFSLFIDGVPVKRGHLVGKELHVHDIKQGDR
jgi:hypothetical protein